MPFGKTANFAGVQKAHEKTQRVLRDKSWYFQHSVCTLCTSVLSGQVGLKVWVIEPAYKWICFKARGLCQCAVAWIGQILILRYR